MLHRIAFFRRALPVAALGAAVLLAACQRESNWLFHLGGAPPLRPTALDYWRAENALLVGGSEDGKVVMLPIAPQVRQRRLLAPAADGKAGAVRLRVDDARDRLWLLDHGALYVYALSSATLLRRHVFLATRVSERQCLPDLALAPDGSAYVADNLRGVIHRVDGGTLEMSEWYRPAGGEAAGIAGFSALAVVEDGRALLAGSAASGEVWRFDLEGTRRPPHLIARGLDGVCGLHVPGNSPPSSLYVTLGMHSRLVRIELGSGADDDARDCLPPFRVQTPTSIASDGAHLYVTHSRLRSLWDHRLSSGIPHNNLVYRVKPC